MAVDGVPSSAPSPQPSAASWRCGLVVVGVSLLALSAWRVRPGPEGPRTTAHLQPTTSPPTAAHHAGPHLRAPLRGTPPRLEPSAGVPTTATARGLSAPAPAATAARAAGLDRSPLLRLGVAGAVVCAALAALRRACRARGAAGPTAAPGTPAWALGATGGCRGDAQPAGGVACLDLSRPPDLQRVDMVSQRQSPGLPPPPNRTRHRTRVRAQVPVGLLWSRRFWYSGMPA